MSRRKKISLWVGGLTLLGLGGGGVGGYFLYKHLHHTNIPNYPNITMVTAYNQLFHTSYANSPAGYAAMKQGGLVTDYTTPLQFSQFACSADSQDLTCTVPQVLGGNAQQVTIPTIVANQNPAQSQVVLTATCKSGLPTTPQLFSATMPQAPQNAINPGFLHQVINPGAVCTAPDGTPVYDFGFTLSAGGQPIDASNSAVLLKYDTEGPDKQVTNLLIGVNPGQATDHALFNGLIINLQTDLG